MPDVSPINAHLRELYATIITPKNLPNENDITPFVSRGNILFRHKGSNIYAQRTLYTRPLMGVIFLRPF